MREIILDTETTGLDPRQGHRIIEVAGVELVDRRPTGRHLHFYVNPEREIDGAATEVHGLTWDDLRDKPRFADVAAELLDFLRGAEWIIHNAPFDVGFLDYELSLCGHGDCSGVFSKVTDTLALVLREGGHTPALVDGDPGDNAGMAEVALEDLHPFAREAFGGLPSIGVAVGHFAPDGQAQAIAGSIFGRTALFLWTGAFFYHLLNGIRHLAWDAGWGFELPTAYRTGWSVLAGSAVLTLAAWALGYWARGNL